MTLLAILLAFFATHAHLCDGFSVKNALTKSSFPGSSSILLQQPHPDLLLLDQRLSSSQPRNSFVSMTQRDPIRMPSQKPMVPYRAPGSPYAQFIDIEAAMYRDRTLMINRFIDESAANNIISIILYLRNENPREKISIYFNVPGGLLRPSLAIYDLLQNTQKTCDIETVNLALCAGFSSLLCAAGTKGMRHAFPNARFLLQRIGIDKAFRGQATDIALEVRNVKACNDRMELELAKLTGQKPEKISADLQRDMYLIADEAVQYGLIDSVLLPSPRKRSARGGPTDLGTFEGEDTQRYQNQAQDDTPGNGRFPKSSPGNQGRRNDDDGPEIAKG